MVRGCFLSLLPSGPQSCRYRASFWHSLCASRFILIALNRLWALRSSEFALHPFIHTFWSPICCATPFWPHPIAATSSFSLSLPFYHPLSLPTCSPTCATRAIPCLTPRSLSLPSPLSIIATILLGQRRSRPGFVSKKEKPAEAKEVGRVEEECSKGCWCLLTFG